MVNIINRLHQLSNTESMPVLFVGHGSPMNAIEENEFVAEFRRVGEKLPKPKAILCISAHWETQGTRVTAMEQPKTIHDFRGFPPELYELSYPAPGSPELANEVKKNITGSDVIFDNQWGLDHGCWSVVKHFYPEADIPVVQLSLDYRKTPLEHYQLARELTFLRNKGVLIIGSGNMVHNLGLVAWDKLKVPGFGYDWALEANQIMKQMIMEGDYKSLANYKVLGKAFELSIPTPEHFLPLIYSLALRQNSDEVSFFNDKAIGGSLTMTSVMMDRMRVTV